MKRALRFTLAAPAALCTALAISSVACSARASSPSPADALAATRRVVVLGDGLAVSPSCAESFPAVLQSRIADRGLPWSVTNAGIQGDTTTGGLARVGALLADDVGVVVVALGANDGLRGVPPLVAGVGLRPATED